MPRKLLLPHKYKKLGWLIFIPAVIAGIILLTIGMDKIVIGAKVFAIYDGEVFGNYKSFSFIYANITDTIVGILFIIGALLIGFSKEKNEDEFISSLRESSLLWAVLVNYVLLIFAFAFIYGTAFFSVMLYNIFTVLIIFIGRFNYVLYRSFKSMSNEKHH